MSQVSVGDRYGRLTVIALIKHRKNPKAECKCDCGNVCFPQRGALKNGRAQSCGCKKTEDFISRATTHNKSKSIEYKTWRSIINRCTNTKIKEYKNYGGRGIKVLWKSFEDFYADMGDRPPNSWIERINNNGNYEKNNCKWVSPKENLKNKRTCKIWIIDGKEFETSTDAARFLNVNPSVVIRGCNGFTRGGKKYAPRKNWSSKLKYIQEDLA